ncbi:hypothetical protein TNIN_317981 [Trichonephila inaurata madagascariensis]|uniref:Uncharacterized protein n=1 Tax=Trichonephila inaurata madagascariensis TaxID=2747483 RepID=A0A8X6IDK7_9ARAC|nr:hypothetical protein TNIN_317981 [Trichonephila inaurata madagascariensis]
MAFEVSRHDALRLLFWARYNGQKSCSPYRDIWLSCDGGSEMNLRPLQKTCWRDSSGHQSSRFIPGSCFVPPEKDLSQIREWMSKAICKPPQGAPAKSQGHALISPLPSPAQGIAHIRQKSILFEFVENRKIKNCFGEGM